MRRGWKGVVRASGRAHGWGGRGLSQGSRVDLRLLYPQFSTDSHMLGENKVNRNPLKYMKTEMKMLKLSLFFATISITVPFILVFSFSAVTTKSFN